MVPVEMAMERVVLLQEAAKILFKCIN